ncbi:hypothetical protein QBC39DRAFT_433773 [Podospora conica]|nr:hypothetical protein QBC39DRAFT_433773 [Schizothecium conicum]
MSPTTRAETALLIPDPLDVPIPPTPELLLTDLWAETFRESMGILQQTNDPVKHASFSIRNKDSWEGVSQQLEVARNHYLNHEGLGGRFKKCYRKVADNITPAIRVVGLVPDMDYAKPITGLFNVFFEAFQLASDTRKQVLEGVNINISPELSRAERLLQSFPTDEHIRQGTVELVVAVLRAAECAICFFTERSLKKGGKMLVQGPDFYQHGVLTAMEEIREKTTALLREASIAEVRVVTQTHKHFGRLSMERRDQRVQKTLEFEEQHLELDEETPTLEYLPRDFLFDERFEVTSTTYQLPLLSIPEIYSMLMLKSESARDTFLVADLMHLVSHKEWSTVESLLDLEQVRGFVTDTQSTSLLIDGDFKDRLSVSPLSGFVSLLHQHLPQANPNVVPLIFFCGLHDDPATDLESGPEMMIRSLVSQLLSVVFMANPSIGFPLDADLHAAQQTGFYGLCDFFWTLAYQLPPSITVLCLLDGIGAFERGEFCDRMMAVMAHMVRGGMSNNLMHGVPRLKVLATSYGKTGILKNYFGVGDYLSMGDFMPNGGGGGYRTERIQRQIQDLFKLS